ncbi:MAG: caspase family protein [Balneolaceae bacterium]
MGIAKPFLITGLILLIFQGCSSTSWIVQDEVMDPNDFEKVASSYFLQSMNDISPNQPVVHFDLMASDTYEFTQRIETKRYIQRYKPRLGYVLLGMAGTGLSYYAALSEDLVKRPTDQQRYALMGAGSLLTGLSFLNMKPSGEPKATGESRLMRKTGTVLEKDTLSVLPYNENKAEIKISYNDRVLVEKTEWPFEGKRISINLAEEIDASQFSGNDNFQIKVEAFYDSLYAETKVPVSSVFEQFVVVNSQVTALRNEPIANSENVLTDLAEGSQLKLVATEGEWHKVLYGISEKWVAAKDVRSIWRPSEFASALSVITVPNMPYGSVDVEQNIPVIGQSDLNSSAFILTNYKYEGELSERVYGARDARLMEEYIIQAFGIRESRIVKAANVNTDRQADRAYSRLLSSLHDEQSLTVYLSGYAEIQDSKLYMIGCEQADGENQHIDLQSLFRALSNLSLDNLIIFADLDVVSEVQNESVLDDLAAIVTESIDSSAVIFGAKPHQRSEVYTSANENKRHSIFTYYLADAIKEGNVTLSSFFNHLDRNISFTSRSIYDRPQNPSFYGNHDLKLVN